MLVPKDFHLFDDGLNPPTILNRKCSKPISAPCAARCFRIGMDPLSGGDLPQQLRRSPWHTALALLRALREERTTPDVASFNATIAASHRWRVACELMRTAGQLSVQRSVVSFNATISAGAWRRATLQLQEMRRLALQPKSSSLNALIAASPAWQRPLVLLEAPDLAVGPAGLGAALAKLPWPLALQLLEEVSKFGLEPNLMMVGAALEGCSLPFALRLLHEAESQLGLRRDVVVFNIVMANCEKAGAWTQLRARRLVLAQ
eukprot:s1625_g13.t1